MATVDEFPSNSKNQEAKTPPSSAPFSGAKKEQAEPKKIEPVVKGEVKRRKQSLGKRFKNTFLGGDARGALSYVTMEVLIPAAKDMIVDAVTQAAERTVFGEVRRRSGGWRPANQTPYNRQYASTRPSDPPWQRPDPRGGRDMSRRARSLHEFDEIVLESRGEAEEVIFQLTQIVEQYQQASLADLYALVGVTSAYTDQKYGWTNLQGSSVQRDRGGAFLLNLPRPEPLD